MRAKDLEIQALSHYLIDEIIMAFGWKKSAVTRGVVSLLLSKVTDRLASICVLTDRKIATQGFPAATGWMAGHWVREVRVRGAECIPPRGPLLIVSNHVGAYDIVVVPSKINRRDIKIIASDTPFFKSLLNASQHMIYANDDPGERMAAARQGIAHLRQAGALLLFGTGLIDPDPAVYSHPETEIYKWSASIDLFLRQVPETQVVISIVSGIVQSKWAHSPLTRLRKVDWQKRRIAEYGQVISQLLFPSKPDIYPSLSIAVPVTVEQLQHESGSGKVLPAVIERGKMLMEEHLVWIR